MYTLTIPRETPVAAAAERLAAATGLPVEKLLKVIVLTAAETTQAEKEVSA